MKIETDGRGNVCGKGRRIKRAHLGDEKWVTWFDRTVTPLCTI
jgi:hypothetical protein